MQVAIGEAPLVVTTPTTSGRGGELSMHDRRPAPSSPVGAAGMIYRQCWNCAPSFGYREEVCVGTALLESLRADLDDMDARVQEAEAEDGVSWQVRKNARYYMYRKYVGEQWGFLGRGKRIRIPPCVVEAIRARFRAPGCDCPTGGALYRCVIHGYTGHRDAPEQSEETE